jgi:hypothetical protein
MSHFQVMLLAKPYPHKYTKIPKFLQFVLKNTDFWCLLTVIWNENWNAINVRNDS